MILVPLNWYYMKRSKTIHFIVCSDEARYTKIFRIHAEELKILPVATFEKSIRRIERSRPINFVQSTSNCPVLLIH